MTAVRPEPRVDVDERDAARHQHAMRLAQGALRIHDVLEHGGAVDRVEAAVRKRQLHRVARVNPRGRRTTVGTDEHVANHRGEPRRRRSLQFGVNADRLGDAERGKRNRRLAVAAPLFQHPHLRNRNRRALAVTEHAPGIRDLVGDALIELLAPRNHLELGGAGGIDGAGRCDQLRVLARDRLDDVRQFTQRSRQGARGTPARSRVRWRVAAT